MLPLPLVYCCVYLKLFDIFFGPRVYPLGSIVIALVRLSVFKYLRDRSLFFLKLCMKLGVIKLKSNTAEILKKNLNVGIKCQKFGFFDIFSETSH